MAFSLSVKVSLILVPVSRPRSAVSGRYPTRSEVQLPRRQEEDRQARDQVDAVEPDREPVQAVELRLQFRLACPRLLVRPHGGPDVVHPRADTPVGVEPDGQ